MDKYRKMNIGLEETINIGQDTYFTSVAPVSSNVVSFEDDLKTGYFYAVKINTEITVLDALHIYNVIDVIHRDKPSKLQIMWTEDGLIASLLINDYCQAVFDFANKAGYCRNGFPENVGAWKQANSRILTDELITSIFSEPV